MSNDPEFTCDGCWVEMQDGEPCDECELCLASCCECEDEKAMLGE